MNDNKDTIDENFEDKLNSDTTTQEPEQEDIFDELESNQEEELTEVEKLQEELGKEKDKFIRLFAEFENFKRRTAKERIDLFKTANQDVMMALLPILDDFDRAYSEISKSKEKELLKGVELISQKLKTTLKGKGLEEIEVKKGEEFNADIHEAITQIPAPSDDLKGKIIDIVEKGYKLGERIIRFPKVVIGQ